MSTTTESDLLVRVRKLLDKAEGTLNAHEADAFSRKAAELIAEHRIDPERLAAVDASDDLRVRDRIGSWCLRTGAFGAAPGNC